MTRPDGNAAARFLTMCLVTTTVFQSVGNECAAQRERADRDLAREHDLAEMNVRLVKDVDYAGTNNPRQKLDLYLPERPAADGPLPMICWVHGGAWRGGDKAHARSILPLVKSGRFVGASIGYRLTSEANWPSQIHDCKAAIRWIRGNADKHNVDPERIAVWGSSAGGHLVAMLGLTDVDDGLEGEIGPHLGVSSSVSCVVDYFGPTELLTMNEQGSSMDHDAPNSPESLLVGGPIQTHKKQAINASPVSYVSKSDKPMLIVHGTLDPLVPYQQSAVLKRKLEAVGVDAIFISVDGGGHGRGFGQEISHIARQFLENQLLGARHTLKDQNIILLP